MAADEKWYFTKEQLANTPSRKCGIDADKELSYRQQAANFIQDMGQRLSVTQLCINTAIVYMHRFYVFHSLSQFHRNAIATAALFLAAKVEEQPRKLEHVIKVAHVCLHKDQPPPDVRSEQYLEQAQDVVFNENVLLQTLGFDVAIDHPHTHVVRCCHLVRASKDLAQASYFMASNSLHMTTMCLQYKPTVVACFCIHLACKWSNWEIPQSNEGKHWFWYVDRSVTSEMLQQLTSEFLHIFDNCPSRLKRRIKSISAKQSPSLNHPSLPNSPFDTEPRQVSPAADGGPTFQSSRPFPLEETKKPSSQSSSSTTSATPSSSSRPPVDYREYREKKERERMEREKAAGVSSGGGNAGGLSSEGQGMSKQQSSSSSSSSHHSSHHAKQQQQASTSSSSKHPGVPGSKPVSHHNHHHGAHRTDAKPSGQQQAVPSQRHSVVSASGQSGRPSRGPRDYNASSNVASYQHTHHTKETTSQVVPPPESSIGTELNPASFEESAAAHIADKSSNNRAIDPKHEKSQRGGAYDPRHKSLEAKEAEQKSSYGKYQQDQRGRKMIDSLEQKCEEVRKLIEKPLPLPKSTARPEAPSQKDDYVAYMMKQQAHSAKYGQQPTSCEKPGPLLATPNLGSRNPPDYVAGSTRDKPGMTKNSSQLQQQSHSNAPGNAATVKKFDNKSSVKNGNSQLVGTDQQEPTNKHEKRSRHQPDEERLQGNATIGQQATNVQHPSQPVKQHKSLFSPEKTTNPRESHPRVSSRSSRQKTPPSTGSATGTITTTTKSSKVHDRVPDQSGNLDHFSSIESSQSNHQNVVQHQQQHHHHHHHHHHHQQQHHSQTQNPQESSSIKATTSHTKRHRTSSIGDTGKQQQQQQQQSIKAEHQIKMETQIKMEKLDPLTRTSEQAIKIEPSVKIEIDENRETYESMKMLGRVPELLQPIRENPTSSNGRSGVSHSITASIPNDLKLPELIKPFEPEPPLRQTSLTNGLDSSAHLIVKHEDSLRDTQDSGFFSRSSQDYLSPRKSAQSISALLQEPLAPMPSLLQSIDEYDAQRDTALQPSHQLQESQNSAQRSSSSSQYTEPRHETLGRDARRDPIATYQQSTTEMSSSGTSLEKDPLLSTVDISALAAPLPTIPEATNNRVLNPAQAPSINPQGVANLDDSCPTTTTTATTTATIPSAAAASAATAARKSGHHKSDKKKKKDKHKHKEKDKDKSRDKKKLKNKDKEKEKHIKITIPKDKLNLSSETAAATQPLPIANPSPAEDKKSPQATATGLKIKIPKERLKATNEATSQSLVQAPLKITIRTSLTENSEVSMSTTSRKRDRSNMEAPNDPVPPTKKQYPHHHSQGTSTTSGAPTTTSTTGTANQQQTHHHHQASQQGVTSFIQQPGQRPNGRHYTSNNKDKHTSSSSSSSSSSHHKSMNKLTQQQQQQLLLQHQQMQLQMQLQQQQHHQHSHPT